MRFVVYVVVVAVVVELTTPADAADLTGSTASTESTRLPLDVTDDPLANSRFLLFGNRHLRLKTLRWAARNRRQDMVAPMIYSLRYLGQLQRPAVVSALQKITRQRIGDDWFKWMQWQQAQSELKTFAGFDVFLTGLLSGLDEDFKKFIYPGVATRIRLEEVVWGGVQAYDGIPPLDHPNMILAQNAGYLRDKELVFGIAINGDVRAYPDRFMDWHEMLNDTVGGHPVSLAYCTLCGSGILYDVRTGSGPARQFGSSGLLYRSNKLMYDRSTHSLWNQFTGEPVIGELAESGLKLPTLPLTTTTWGEWRRRHPETKVLALETGFQRDYRPGAAYGDYFKSGELMFPSLTDDRTLRQKAQVFGLRISGVNRAWPLKRFSGGKVINDQVGVVPVVLIGDAQTRNVRAYRRGAFEFSLAGTDLTQVESNGQLWRVEEDALVSSDGELMTRLPGHLSFWFAWYNYLGAETLAQ